MPAFTVKFAEKAGAGFNATIYDLNNNVLASVQVPDTGVPALLAAVTKYAADMGLTAVTPVFTASYETVIEIQ
jgi:hypothetical protein